MVVTWYIVAFLCSVALSGVTQACLSQTHGLMLVTLKLYIKMNLFYNVPPTVLTRRAVLSKAQ